MKEIRSLLADMQRGHVAALSWDTDLADTFALDSLAVVELQDRLEDAFAVRIPVESLGALRTPGDWLRAVSEAAAGTTATPAPPPAVPVAPTTGTLGRTPGTPWAQSATTLVDALTWHVERHPDLVSVRVLSPGDGHPYADLTYGSLYAAATTSATVMAEQGVEPGDRVAIMLPTGTDYFVLYMAVLLAGGAPVPVYPPARMSVLEEHLRRQARLLHSAGATLLVTVPEALLAARLLRARVPSLRAVLTPASSMAPDRGSATGRQATRLRASPDDVALVQYTSGSTGDPKGVVLTHAQLLANIRAMGEAARVDSSDVFVSWLPLYHDMGLIGAWQAASLYFGMLLVVMSPLTFLSRPARWLEAMTRYSGTLSAGPNFGYQTCIDRISDAELESLDLSSWRLAFTGSEPVQAATVERFARRFGPRGFRPEAMCPAYGLAEVGVGATFSPVGRRPRIERVRLAELEDSGEAVTGAGAGTATVALVSCGRALPGYRLRIADETGNSLPERHVGKVECRGPSVTTGYLSNEGASRQLWDHGWLDTGDTGYLADGELFLTGRRKDMIVRAGRNLHPEELEQVLGQLPGLGTDAVAAFGVNDRARGTEQLVVVAETPASDPLGQERLRTTMAERSVQVLGVAPDEIVLVPPCAIPRTASGKVRRGEARAAYLGGTLGRPPAPPALQLVRFAWSGLVPAAGILARAVARRCYAAWVWTVLVVIGAPLWLALLLPLSPSRRWRLVRGAGRVLQEAAGIPITMEGTFPDGGAAPIVVANHPSFLDGLVLLLALEEPAAFVSSDDFARQKLAGPFLRRLGAVFVHRAQPAQASEDVQHLVEMVRRGERLVIFPEGSLAPSPGVRPFHLGPFTVAATAGCSVLPVGIVGTRHVLRPGRYLPHRSPVRIVVGALEHPLGSDFAAGAELAERVRRSVASLSGEPALSAPCAVRHCSSSSHPSSLQRGGASREENGGSG